MALKGFSPQPSMVLDRHPSAKMRVECAPKKRTKPKINQVMQTPCEGQNTYFLATTPAYQ
jgi:hypothetical protein